MNISNKSTKTLPAKNSWESILNRYSPQNNRKLITISTLDKCALYRSITLNELKGIYGDIKTESLIKAWLINLQLSLNVKEALGQEQIDEAAMMILNDMGNMMAHEISFIINDVKRGKYGVLYNVLSLDKLLTWFKTHLRERIALDVKARNKYIDIELKDPVPINEIKDFVQKMADSLKINE